MLRRTLLGLLALWRSKVAMPYPESAHPYTSGMDATQTYTEPGSPVNIWVTFDKLTNVEDGYDFLYLYDGANNPVGDVGGYTDVELASVTIAVPGDTVKVRLTSDSSVEMWGYRVSAVATVAPPAVRLTDAAIQVDSGVVASQVLVGAGGTGPYTFAVVSGWPSGLTLASDGTVGGTPTTPEVKSAVIRVTDALSVTADVTLLVYVEASDAQMSPTAMALNVLNLTTQPHAPSYYYLGIDSLASGWGHLGPYWYCGAWYALVSGYHYYSIFGCLGSIFLAKSTDLGLTWNIVSDNLSANTPAIQSLHPDDDWFSSYQDGRYIYVYGITRWMGRFDLGTEAWTDDLVTLPNDYAAPLGYQQEHVRRRSDGSYVIFYLTDDYEYIGSPPNNEWYRCGYRIYSGGVWSAVVNVMFAGQAVHVNPAGVVLGPDDRFYMFCVTCTDSSNQSSGDDLAVYCAVLGADDVLHSPTLVTDSPGGTYVRTRNAPLANLVGLADVSSSVVAVPISGIAADGVTPYMAVATATPADEPVWTCANISDQEPTITVARSNGYAPNMPYSFAGCAVNGADVAVLWRSGDEYDNRFLYGCTRVGGTWNSAVKLLDATTDLRVDGWIVDISVTESHHKLGFFLMEHDDDTYGTWERESSYDDPTFSIWFGLVDWLTSVSSGCRYHAIS